MANKPPKKSKKNPPKSEALLIVPRKHSTGRKCTICTHPEIKAINSYINEGKSFRHIASQIFNDVNKYRSISRHVEKCLKLEIKALIQQNKLENAVDHYGELVDQLQFAKEMQFAAREWLSDPLNGRVSFMPRAEELDVIYMDYINLDFFGRPSRQRQKLSIILDKIQSALTHIKFKGHGYKISDTRDFALRTIDAVDKLLDKFARVEGIYKRDQEIEYELTLRAVARIEKIITQQSARDSHFDPSQYLMKIINLAAVDFGVKPEQVEKEFLKRQPQILEGVQ